MAGIPVHIRPTTEQGVGEEALSLKMAKGRGRTQEEGRMERPIPADLEEGRPQREMALPLPAQASPTGAREGMRW